MSMRVLESQQCMPRVLRMSSMVWRQRNQRRQRRRRILRATLPLSGQCPMMLSSSIMCCIASGPKEFFVCFMWWMGFFMHFFRQNSKLCVLMAVWIKTVCPGRATLNCGLCCHTDCQEFYLEGSVVPSASKRAASQLHQQQHRVGKKSKAGVRHKSKSRD